MFIKQLSIFLENKGGSLGEVLKILSGENVNIASASLADTNDFGVLRVLVSVVITSSPLCPSGTALSVAGSRISGKKWSSQM